MSETLERRKRHTAIVRFAVRMAHMVRTLRIYPPGHSAMDIALQSVSGLARNLMDLTGNAETTFFLQGPRIYVGADALRPPKGMYGALRNFSEYMGDRGVGGMKVLAIPEPFEVGQVVQMLEDEPGGGGPGPEVLNEWLERNGVRWCRFERIRSALADDDVGGAGDPALICLRLYLRGVRAVHRLYAKGISPAVLLELNKVSQGIIELMDLMPRRTLELATPRRVVPYELRHPVHMAILGVALGRRLGLNPRELLELTLATFMADCGMRVVDPSVRRREGKLAPEELAEIRRHPIASVQNLLEMPAISPQVRRRIVVSFEHHQGLNGAGYPRVRRANELHPFSRIVCVVDAWDALRATTPWRVGKSRAEVLRVMKRESGTRFEPILVDHLEALITSTFGLSDGGIAEA